MQGQGGPGLHPRRLLYYYDRSYRFMVINNSLLLVDPASGIVVADLTE